MRNNRFKGRKSNKRKLNIWNKIETKKILPIIIIILIIAICSIIFALINSFNDKIISRIKIEGIDVSKLELTQAYEKINAEIEERISKNIIIKYNEYETTISLKQLETTIDTKEEVNYAYKIGRNPNIVKSNYQILFTILFGRNIEGTIKINEEELNKFVEDIAVKIPGSKKESSYYIEDENLIINSGEKGIQINKEELKKEIIKKVEEQVHKDTEQIINLNVEEVEPQKVDIDEIYKEIYKQAENAYYEIETSKV